MGRWTPDTKGRLAKAALELYLERGYPQTTVAEIAAHAGTTERTFFRHFADKSEVLFGGNTALQDEVVRLIELVAPDMSPLETVIRGIEAAQAFFQGDTAPFRQRQALIYSHPELTSRELHKVANMGHAITAALEERGVVHPQARLAAEAGLLVFRIAFERWLAQEQGAPVSWSGCVRQTLSDLRALNETSLGSAP